MGREHEPTGPSGFGDRLRALRESAGLSQTALAGDRFSPSYISHLESGRREPTPSVVTVLATRLGVPGSALVPEAPPVEQALVLAEAALGLGRPDEALDLLAPLRPGLDVEAMASDPVLFRAGVAVATALERVPDVDGAVLLLDRLRAAADRAPHRVPWVDVTIASMRVLRQAGDESRAIDIGERGVQRARELGLGPVDGYVGLVSTLASAYTARGDLLSAQAVLDDVLDHLGPDGDPIDRAKAYWNAASNAAERGAVAEGLHLADQAAALMRGGGDLGLQARVRHMRAWILLQLDPPRAEEARTELRAVLPALRQHAGSWSVASAEVELARAELLLGRPEVAHRHATSALKHLDASHLLERADALTLLGAASVSLGETTVGVALLEQAADELVSAENPRAAATAWRQLAAVHRAMGDTERAMEALERALDARSVRPHPLVTTTSAPRSRRTASRTR